MTRKMTLTPSMCDGVHTRRPVEVSRSPHARRRYTYMRCLSTAAAFGLLLSTAVALGAPRHLPRNRALVRAMAARGRLVGPNGELDIDTEPANLDANTVVEARNGRYWCTASEGAITTINGSCLSADVRLVGRTTALTPDVRATAARMVPVFLRMRG